MKRRFLVVVGGAAIVVAALAGCGEEKKTTTETKGTTTATTETKGTTTTTAAAPGTPTPGAGADELSGTYSLKRDGSTRTVNGAPDPVNYGAPQTWIIAPCGSGCASATMPNGNIHDLHLTNGRWESADDSQHMCSDNKKLVPSTWKISLDAATQAGTETIVFQCGTTPDTAVTQVTLTKVS